MNKQLNYSRTTRYGGRSGRANMTGMHIFTDTHDNVELFPLNTKGGSVKIFYQIPKEDIPALIDLLKEAIGETSEPESPPLANIEDKEFEEINFDYADDKGVTHVDGYHKDSAEGQCLGYIFAEEFYPKDNDIRANKQVMEAVKKHLAELRQQARQVRMFHLATHDSDAGSMGTIQGTTPEELTAALKAAIAENNNVDADTVNVPDDIDWEFWQSRHTEEIIVSFSDDGHYVDQTITATYTWIN